MHTKKDIVVSISPEDILRQIKTRESRRQRSKDLRPVVEAVCQSLPGLLQPAVVWSLTVKEKISNGTVYLRNPESGTKGVLAVGKRSDLLDPSQEIILAVKTIGPCLEEEVRRFESEDPVAAYILDVAGVMALNRVSDWFRKKVRDLACMKGWGVSPSLLPGSLEGWPVEGQKEICHFLDLEEIDVSINSFSVLRPHKSVSVAIGLGPGYTEQVVASLCEDCHRKDICPWRR